MKKLVALTAALTIAIFAVIVSDARPALAQMGSVYQTADGVRFVVPVGWHVVPGQLILIRRLPDTGLSPQCIVTRPAPRPGPRSSQAAVNQNIASSPFQHSDWTRILGVSVLSWGSSSTEIINGVVASRISFRFSASNAPQVVKVMSAAILSQPRRDTLVTCFHYDTAGATLQSAYQREYEIFLRSITLP